MKRACAIPGTMDRSVHTPPYWRMASTCTGAGTMERVTDALVSALNDVLPDETPHRFRVT